MAQVRLEESLRAVEAEVAAGHPDLALAHCLQLQAQFPRAIAVQRALGEIYLAQRKPREAVAALDRVLQADPEDARAYCLRAAVYQIHGDTAQALVWYARACDVRPDDTILRSTYGKLAASLGWPPYSPSRMGLARLYLRGGLYTHAIREWEALIAERADALDAQVGLAETLWRGNHTQPATDRCLRILANAPTCIKPMLLLAVMHVDAGRLDEAQRHALRASELDADNRIAWSLLADRFNAGDVTLQKIILGAAKQTQPPLFGTSATAGPARDGHGISRPLANAHASSLPLPPASRVTATSLRELPVQPTRDPHLRDGIRQTEIMLGRDEPRSVTPLPITAANYLGNGPSLMPPSASPGPGFVPPVLAEQGANLEEAEVQQGLAWLRWLQQQSAAQAPSGAMPGLPSGSMAQPAQPFQASGSAARAVPPMAAMPAMPQPPAGSAYRGLPAAASGPQPPISSAAPAIGNGQASPTVPPRLTGPQPTHTAEELRAMFAELEPAPSAASGQWPNSSTNGTPSRGSIPSSPLSHDARSGQNGQSGVYRNDAYTAGDDSGGQRTLEEIERGYTASGFQHVEPRPGLLADLAARDVSEPSPERVADAPASSQASGQSPNASYSGTRPSPASARSTTEAEPAPADPAARLAEARRRREAGDLDAALGEYGAALHDGPDLLDDIVQDLEAELATRPTHPGLHQLLGDARIRQGDYLGALESYNHAVALGQERQ